MNGRNKKQEKKEWLDENMSHGAFALTQEEIDFYLTPPTKELLKM